MKRVLRVIFGVCLAASVFASESSQSADDCRKKAQHSEAEQSEPLETETKLIPLSTLHSSTTPSSRRFHPNQSMLSAKDLKAYIPNDLKVYNDFEVVSIDSMEILSERRTVSHATSFFPIDEGIAIHAAKQAGSAQGMLHWGLDTNICFHVGGDVEWLQKPTEPIPPGPLKIRLRHESESVQDADNNIRIRYNTFHIEIGPDESTVFKGRVKMTYRYRRPREVPGKASSGAIPILADSQEFYVDVLANKGKGAPDSSAFRRIAQAQSDDNIVYKPVLVAAKPGMMSVSKMAWQAAKKWWTSKIWQQKEKSWFQKYHEILAAIIEALENLGKSKEIGRFGIHSLRLEGDNVYLDTYGSVDGQRVRIGHQHISIDKVWEMLDGQKDGGQELIEAAIDAFAKQVKPGLPSQQDFPMNEPFPAIIAWDAVDLGMVNGFKGGMSTGDIYLERIAFIVRKHFRFEFGNGKPSNVKDVVARRGGDEGIAIVGPMKLSKLEEKLGMIQKEVANDEVLLTHFREQAHFLEQRYRILAQFVSKDSTGTPHIIDKPFEQLRDFIRANPMLREFIPESVLKEEDSTDPNHTNYAFMKAYSEAEAEAIDIKRFKPAVSIAATLIYFEDQFEQRLRYIIEFFNRYANQLDSITSLSDLQKLIKLDAELSEYFSPAIAQVLNKEFRREVSFKAFKEALGKFSSADWSTSDFSAALGLNKDREEHLARLEQIDAMYRTADLDFSDINDWERFEIAVRRKPELAAVFNSVFFDSVRRELKKKYTLNDFFEVAKINTPEAWSSCAFAHSLRIRLSQLPVSRAVSSMMAKKDQHKSDRGVLRLRKNSLRH